MVGVVARVAVFIASAICAHSAWSAEVKIVPFEDLIGWDSDDHAAALTAFNSTCGDLNEQVWAALCAVGKETPDAKVFFETFFRPLSVRDGQAGLITGYYEPELSASRHQTQTHRFPVYGKPQEVVSGQQWLDRRTIETSGVLAGRGLELAWVSDPTALFYMQIQGSGRLRFADGSVMRLGYGGTNGHKFISPGEMLVERGIYEPHQVSSTVVGNWVRRNPGIGLELLRDSPNFVFFRKIGDLPAEFGPKGAMNRPITAGRTLAVDRAFYPLGIPIWMEKGGADVMRKLMVAQDTGSAIKGSQRADLFVGSGDEAGKIASRIHDPVRLIALLPIDLAISMAKDH